MSAIYAPGTRIDTRSDLLNLIGSILRSPSGARFDEALSLMIHNSVTADELNAHTVSGSARYAFVA